MEKGAGNFLSGLLMVLGVTWVLLTGGCTLFFGFIAGALSQNQPSHGNELMQGIVSFGIIGLICTAPGWVLILISRMVRRRT